MKKLILVALCAVSFGLFAELERDEAHTAYVLVYDTFTKSDNKGYIPVVNPETGKTIDLTLYAVDVSSSGRKPVLEAVSSLASWQTDLEAACDAASIPKQLKATNISKWSDMMSQIIKDGLDEQQRLDQLLVSEKVIEIAEQAKDQDAAIEQLKLDAETLATELNTAGETASAQFQSMGQTISANKSELSALITANKNRLDGYNTELKSINAQLKEYEGKTDEESKQHVADLKARKQEIQDIMAALSASSAAALAANTTIAAVQAKLLSMEASLKDLVSKPILYFEMGEISTWNGYVPKDEASQTTTFMRPYKLDGENRYQSNETTENFLGDRGVVQYDSIEYQDARKEQELPEPPYPFAIWEELESKEGEYGNTNRCSISSMLPPKNWVDGVTIIYTNGVYVCASNNISMLDGASVYTNGNSHIEIRGFSGERGVDMEKTDEEYDYLPNKTFGDNPTNDEQTEDEWYIDWQTNTLEAIEKALGFKKFPKKSELNSMMSSKEKIEEFFQEGKLVEKMFGKTGLVERLNAAIKVENAYDDVSVGTNGEAKTEIKNFAYKGSRNTRYETFVRDWEDDDEEDKPTASWKPYLIPDADMEDAEEECKSLQEISNYDIQGKAVQTLQLYGFNSATKGAVPYAYVGDVNREIKWTDEETEATADAPKVLTFNGTKVSWGDAVGGITLKFVGNDEDTDYDENPVLIGSGPTNTITFASADDSNVKVKCEKHGDAGVKITFGVYYK